ncbi:MULTISPECIES: thiolase family protein [unclassified Paenibacillus]|uniref:thiolase family protein n=1 Tax=unclassified Paenibacillus TaxID=185978 RepID=UPI001AE12861|nr:MULTISPECIES: thiolase family protein [unclassified Paenibacillus]MBP1154028.1 acetyl-CoA acetyltransferase [Paenibacillus sp. PvP091]MBP1170587.1 acetyl-CoA acetyltransferase [Paenibacillus sp. PvR098]MBP2441615.1 acetyl-CoA acetyltransferase [Paenibacillus sp. PvP052]
MKDNVYVLGTGIIRMGKYLDRSLKDLALEAITGALVDASVQAEQVECAFVANGMGGIVTGQECMLGQIVTQHAGIKGIPVFNIENACASGASALHLAIQRIRAGGSRLALVVGVEKLYHADRTVISTALASASDVELLPKDVPPTFFMETYAMQAKRYMEKYRCGVEPFAQVSVKNRYHASLNPYAQYRNEVTLDEVLQSPMIVDPLTRLMCSPISDGAAALIIGTAEHLNSSRPKIRVAASQVVSGNGHGSIVVRAAQSAFKEAEMKPVDVSVVELHDATCPAEIKICEELGIFGEGKGHRAVLEGYTTLGGRVPVNTSGGLVSKGHPIAATGVAQIIELYEHLCGRAGERQVENARVGLAENAGGWVNHDAGVCAVHLLERVE